MVIYEAAMAKTAKRRKSRTRSKRKRPAIGAVATNFHEGSRSEVLADYLFSMWGTVTPARRQSDYGLDLYCTLTERVGRRARVHDYFSVQVKSTDDAWEFNDAASVKWLIEHPIPLFLCVVSKKEGLVSIYHVFPRFVMWSLGEIRDRLELRPGGGKEGNWKAWDDGSSFSLSAPIIQANLADLIDPDRMEKLRKVFEYWVDLDRENCGLIRQGLLRFRRPSFYRVNEIPKTDLQEERMTPDLQFLNRGILRLAEAIECIGGQLGNRGERELALKAALLLEQI